MMEITLLSIAEAALLPPSFGQARFPKRMQRAERFVRREDALRCIGAGALLSAVLGVKESSLRENAYHKPFVPDLPVHFNLSHSGEYCMLATDEEEIGADLEKTDPDHLSLAPSVYQPEELAWMQEDPLSRFFVLWTLKESVMKQCGLGFHLSPLSFSVMPLLRGESICPCRIPVYAWTGERDGYILSVCARHPIQAPVIRLLTAEEIVYKTM